MPTLRPRLSLALLALLALLAACGRNAPQGARVFAAASLTAAFTELGAEFEKASGGDTVELNFAGTSQLVVQVNAGARADVFASADHASMDRIVEQGGVVGEPAPFATNRLCIVVQKGNPHGIRSLADLARADLRVLLCGPRVPAGRYAREVLARAGAKVSSRSDEPSVKAVTAKVSLGEADAGIVYTTDAAVARERLDEVPILPEHNVLASYPIAVLDRGKARDVGARFVAFVGSPAGRAVLTRYGFGTP